MGLCNLGFAYILQFMEAIHLKDDSIDFVIVKLKRRIKYRTIVLYD